MFEDYLQELASKSASTFATDSHTVWTECLKNMNLSDSKLARNRKALTSYARLAQILRGPR